MFVAKSDFDPTTGMVCGVQLSPQQARIFAALAHARSRGITIDSLIYAVWIESGKDEPETAAIAVRVVISRMRRKLKKVGLTIRNHWGFGYALEQQGRKAQDEKGQEPESKATMVEDGEQRPQADG